MKEKRIKILSIALIGASGALIFFSWDVSRNNKEVLRAPGTAATTTPDSVQSAPPALPVGKTEPQLRAAGAYLITNGEPLYAMAEEKSWPIASLTKLMSAFVVRKLIPPDEVVIVDAQAVAAFGDAGEFKKGERFKTIDLERAMLVASSNDAAKALAMHYGEEEFVSYMNEVAKEIGMTNTVFTDAAGLSPRNLSTVNDLRVLVQTIWINDPEIFAMTRSSTVILVDIDAERSRKLYSTNAFAGRSDFLGGKTGQIPDAGGNLVSIFNLPDKSSPVVIIVLGANDRFKETEKILTKL